MKQTIWITGASSGIGKALALAYARQKHCIILSSRNEKALKETAAECRQSGAETFVACIDLENEKTIKDAAREVLKKFPRIDILINNGGASQRSLVLETPVELDRKIMNINFFGAVILTKEVLPSMIQSGGGNIVIISSVVGKFGFPLRSAYAASKHALQGFFDSLRAELYDRNIRVTIVSPGRIYTDISINSLNKSGGKYGIMDEGQAHGLSAEKCALAIIKAVKRNKKELLIGGKEVLMVYIRRFLTPLYYRLARKVKAT